MPKGRRDTKRFQGCWKRKKWERSQRWQQSWRQSARRKSQSMSKWLWHLTASMLLSDFSSLLRSGNEVPRTYVFDQNSRSVFACFPNELMWPIEYLIGFHHHRLLFSHQRLPSLQEAGHAITQWENRFRWLLTLQDNDDPNRHVRRKPRCTPQCEAILDSVQVSIISDIKDEFSVRV